MDSTRHTQGPSGIKKANKQGRRPGKTACTACHARKKRCDIAPPYNQCTHCRKEDQLCIPRDTTERPTRQMLNRSQNASKNTSKNESQFHVNDFLPMGIDHEVPRWSAFYSSYSEIRRLLPSLTSASSSPSSEMEDIAPMHAAPSERNQHVSLSELDCSRHFQSEDLYRHCAEEAPIKGISIPVSRSRSQSPASLDERGGPGKALACETEILYGGLDPGEVIFPSGGDSRSAHDVFMNDLDALLRF